MKGFELVFFRHGIAADSAPDSSRPLTEDGIRKTYSSAEGLKKMAIPFDRVFTSPWLRASQTAKILSEVLMIPAPEEMPELAGDHTAAELLEALHNCQSRCFLLVGHQPLLGDAVATLLGARGRCEIDLRKERSLLHPAGWSSSEEVCRPELASDIKATPRCRQVIRKASTNALRPKCREWVAEPAEVSPESGYRSRCLRDAPVRAPSRRRPAASSEHR